MLIQMDNIKKELIILHYYDDNFTDEKKIRLREIVTSY